MIEVGSEETGWNVISCPTSAAVNGACYSGSSTWGGFDIDRYVKGATGGYPEVYRAIFILSIPIMVGIISLMKDLVHLT